MTKQDLADALVSNTNLTKSQAIQAIDGLMLAAREALASGNNIYLRGFGTFRIIRRAEKAARNITRKTTVMVPAHNIVKFIPCNDLKAQIK